MLVFRSVGFSGGWKTREPRHLTLGVRINDKLTIEPGPQWGGSECSHHFTIPAP